MWFFWILFFILLIALINTKGSPETEEKLRKQKNIEINRNIRVKKRYKDSSERKDLIRQVILIIIALFLFLWIGTVNNFNVPTIIVGTLIGIFFIIKKIFQASKIERQIYKEELALDKKEEEKEKN